MTAAGYYAVWALLAGVAVALWLCAHRSESGLARPGDVVRRLATGPALRVALIVAVSFAGWHLFAR